MTEKAKIRDVIPDRAPGFYCCIAPGCDHPREQVFHGGGAEG